MLSQHRHLATSDEILDKSPIRDSKAFILAYNIVSVHDLLMVHQDAQFLNNSSLNDATRFK